MSKEFMKNIKSVLAGAISATTVLSTLVFPAMADGVTHTFEQLGYMNSVNACDNVKLSENWTGGNVEKTLDDANYGTVIVLKSSKTNETQQQLGYIDLESFEAQKYSFSFDLNTIDDKKEMRFYFRDAQGGDVAHITLKDGIGTISKIGKYVASGFSGDNEFAKGFTYESGQWMNLKMVIDTAKKEVDWYINDKKIVTATTESTALISRVIPFYGTTPDVTEYGYIDNFNLLSIEENKISDDTVCQLGKYSKIGYMDSVDSKKIISLSENWTGGNVEDEEKTLIVLRSSKTNETQQQLGYIDLESFEAQKYSFSFDLKPLDDKKEIRFYFRDANAGEVAHIALKDGIGTISKTGKNVASGFAGENDAAKGFSYAKNEWLRLEMIVDTENKSVEWYVNGNFVTLATTASETAYIARILPFYGTTPDVKDYGYIDNFKLSLVTDNSGVKDINSTVSYRKFDDGEKPNTGLMQAASPFTAYKNEEDDAHSTVAYVNKSGAGEGGNITILGRGADGNIVTSGGTYQVPADKDYKISFDMKTISGEFAMFMFDGNNARYMFMAYDDTQKLGLRKNSAAGWEPIVNLGNGTNSNYTWNSYTEGVWHTVDLVVDRSEKKVDLYIDGKYSATSILPESASTDIRKLMIYSSAQATAQFDNFRLSTMSAGAFYPTAKLVKGEKDKIVVTFTELPDNFYKESVVVTDENGVEVEAEVSELSGHTFVITTDADAKNYNVRFQERMISAVSGNPMAGNVVTVRTPRFEMTENKLYSDGTTLGENELATVSDGADISYKVSFENWTTTPVKRTVLIGSYGSDGRLLDVDVENITINANSEITVNPIVTKTSDTKRVCGYIWTTDLMPVELPVTSSVLVSE